LDDGVGVDLYWIPLGAGQHVVRVSGRIFEAVSASIHRRSRCDLYHSALVVTIGDGRSVIEMAPVLDRHGERRGVVAEGPVGTRFAGKLRIFRYEIRRWHDGEIPDAAAAVDVTRLDVDAPTAERILDLVESVPVPVWGRDELATGDMWNSNSVVSWRLSACGVDVAAIGPPAGGRAPGWDAGVAVAARAQRV
jgi:hypothetical protein